MDERFCTAAVGERWVWYIYIYIYILALKESFGIELSSARIQKCGSTVLIYI